MITQGQWRWAGGIAIGCSAVMAFWGVRLQGLRDSLLFFCLYWGAFLVCFVVALYCAFLDWRYIRMQYALARRQLFKETLGEEGFRKALSAGEDDARKKEQMKRGGGSRMN